MKTTISRRSFLKISGLTIAVSVTPFGYTILNASEKKDLKTFNPICVAPHHLRQQGDHLHRQCGDRSGGPHGPVDDHCRRT